MIFMNKVKFSVLLSIYYKEMPEDFRECMESIYSPTVLPDESVLVEDGHTDAIFTNPKDRRTLDYITGRFG